MLREQSWHSGMMEERIIYTAPAPRDPAAIRAEKRKITTAAQAKINAKLCWQSLMRLLASNFLPGHALVITLTFDEDHLPAERKGAQAALKKFRGRMAKSRQRRGRTFFAAYSIEHVHEHGRWHVHLVVNATGNDYQEIRSCWPFGTDVEIHPLEVNRKKDYETLARYMCKERPDSAGQHVWGCTRNCRRPVKETRIVPDDTPLIVPDDAVNVIRESYQNRFGLFEYVRYTMTEPEKIYASRPSSKRRRK